MTGLGIVLGLLVALVSLPMLVFVVQVLLSLPGRREESEFSGLQDGADAEPQPSADHARWMIVVPAHNEAAQLPQNLALLTKQVTDPSDILVVADNCSDQTAEIARRAGVSVLERHDADRRGKGYALAAGLERIADRSLTAVVFVDADCRLTPGSATRLAAAAMRTGRPVQGIYLLDHPHDEPNAAISWLAMLFKNLIRPRGWARLGGPCQLTGTGFALPWELIKPADFASSHIVEDMQLGIDLAFAGYPPQRCPEATVTSAMAPTEESASTQRRRWEHGHLATILTQVPRLISRFVATRDRTLLLMAVDLAVPPLSLLLMAWAVVWLLTTAGLYWGVVAPFVVASALGVMIAFAVGIAWYRYARDVIPFRHLLFAPAYILWKLPIYTRFLWNRERNWVRTERADG